MNIIHFNALKSKYYPVLFNTAQALYASVDIIYLMLWILMTYALASFSWSWHRFSDLKMYQEHKQMSMAQMHIKRPPINLGETYLMGQAPVKTAAVVMEPLFLDAILYDDKPHERIAWIRHSSGELKAYHIGEECSPGIKILDISAQSIKIGRAGQAQELKLEQYPNDFISDKPMTQTHEFLQ